jgi:hypothetical protein
MPVRPGLTGTANVARQTWKPATKSQTLSDCFRKRMLVRRTKIETLWYALKHRSNIFNLCLCRPDVARVHRASSRRISIFDESLAGRSYRPAYCCSTIIGIPPLRVKSPQDDREHADSVIVTGVLSKGLSGRKKELGQTSVV